MYTISKLCKEYNLSRSTLLYYDSIGLLKASERMKSNYRLYSKEDKERLEQICLYKGAGVSLEHIKELLNANKKNEDALNNLHVQFEKKSPQEHKIFLKFLGIDKDEIKDIRSKATAVINKFL